jgi:hypothetical protein
MVYLNARAAFLGNHVRNHARLSHDSAFHASDEGVLNACVALFANVRRRHEAA